MKIEVTAEDIAKGERMEPECCPVAIAAKRAFGVNKITVDKRCLFVGGYPVCPAALPQDVSRRIDEYDETGVMEPFSFELAS